LVPTERRHPLVAGIDGEAVGTVEVDRGPYLEGGVDKDRRRDPQQHRSISPTNLRRGTLALRARINEVAAAHLAVPEANVIWTDEAIVRFAGVDIAVAIAAPAGLVTPVIRGVERLSLTALARTVRGLVERAGSGQLRQAELEGGSTTVTNLGRFGTEEFTAIINPPHSSILSVGAIAKRPVVLDSGEITARSTMNVVLSVDHRAIDVGLAAEWMRALTQAFRTPLTLLV